MDGGDPRRIAMEALRGRWRVPGKAEDGGPRRPTGRHRSPPVLPLDHVSNCQFGSLPINSLLCFNDDADDTILYGPSTRNYTSGAEKRKGSAAGPSSSRVLAQVAETGRTANSGEPISHRQAVCGISNGTRKTERDKKWHAPCPLLMKSLPLQCWKQPSALRVCRSWDIGCSCIGALRKIGRSTIVVGNLRKLALIEFIELLRRYSSSTGSTVRTCGALEVVNCRSARRPRQAAQG